MPKKHTTKQDFVVCQIFAGCVTANNLFVVCPIESTRQTTGHTTKSWIPVVSIKLCTGQNNDASKQLKVKTSVNATLKSRNACSHQNKYEMTTKNL